MTDTDDTATDNRRSGERAPLDGRVTVHFPEEPLVGPGENISDAGVFFVVDQNVRVKVEVEGRDGTVEGELVRFQSMGEGRTGIAIRFV